MFNFNIEFMGGIELSCLSSSSGNGVVFLDVLIDLEPTLTFSKKFGGFGCNFNAGLLIVDILDTTLGFKIPTFGFFLGLSGDSFLSILLGFDETIYLRVA